MKEQPAASPVTQRIAQRVRELRTARGLSLDELATHCGVSRSMISLIERGESSPTAVLLEKLAAGLGAPLASLFEPPPEAASPVSRRADQLAWRDPASGYVRRNISPGGANTPAQIVEVSFPAGARVSYDASVRVPRVHQQIWVLEGSIVITLGTESYTLAAGDCLAHLLEQPITYHNPTARRARYAVVLASETSFGRIP